MSVTWAVFVWKPPVDGRDPVWHLVSLTPVDEFATELEESYASDDIPCQVVGLEDPPHEHVAYNLADR